MKSVVEGVKEVFHRPALAYGLLGAATVVVILQAIYGPEDGD